MSKYAVVVPAWNASATIAETLESILAQTIPPAEIIVVNDGSTDSTAKIAADHGPLVRVITTENAGVGAASNIGVAAAECPLIAFLDADDLWMPQKIEVQISHMQANTDVDIVMCHQRQFRHGYPDDGTGKTRSGLIRSAIIMKAPVFDLVGPIIDPIGNCGDMVDWLARAREAKVKMIELPDVLVARRITPGSLSSGLSQEKNAGYLAVAHAALLRRRAAQKSEKA